MEQQQDGQETETVPTPTKDAAAPLADVSKSGILGYAAKAGAIHEVKAFGGIVRVKEWTAAERDAFEGSLVIGRGKTQRVSTANIRAKMFVRAVVDATGHRVFTDEEAAQVGQLPAAEVDQVYAKIQEINSLSDEDIEELAGNSDTAPSGSGQ